MTAGGGFGGEQRLLTAVLAIPRALREDLWTVATDPMPRLARPRWLAWLPHVVVALLYILYTSAFVTDSSLGSVGVLLTGVQAVTMILALFRPVLAWWTTTTTMVVGFLTTGAEFEWGSPAFISLAVVLFLLALRVRPRAVVAALVISLLAGLAGAGFNLHGGQDTRRTAVVLAAVTTLGAVLRARRTARVRLVAQEGVTAEERVRRTVLEERGRIARELHDVVAHHLSVISIQAQVAPHLVAEPPAELLENLTGIRQNAIEALIELRRVLGVLRLEDTRSAEARHAPQPTLDRLGELVDNVRAAGVAVTTEFTGARRLLSPGVELSAFRLVQEALSNAIRHAPGAAVRVVIAYRPASLTIRVRNSAPTGPTPPSPSPGAGHGLLGMRERAGMLGGELVTGPTPDGGYEVTAILPTPADPADGITDTDPIEDTA